MAKNNEKIEKIAEEPKGSYIRKDYAVSINYKCEFDNDGQVSKTGKGYILLRTPTNQRGCVLSTDSLPNLISDLGNLMKKLNYQ